MDEFDLEDFTRGFTGVADVPDWMKNLSDAGGGSDFGNTGNFGKSSDDLARDFLSGMGDIQQTEGFGVAGTGVQNTPATTISPSKVSPDMFARVLSAFKTPSGDIDWLKLLLMGLGGYAGYKNATPPPQLLNQKIARMGVPSTRRVQQGKYGPIFAAQGGIMSGYAQGGPVKMEDGGFVMTKKAVDGAGGPQGIRSMLPEARMIRGPGTGTSDSIPAYIQGPNGRTPARLSNGEAYVPPGRDTRGLYSLMKTLERSA